MLENGFVYFSSLYLFTCDEVFFGGFRMNDSSLVGDVRGLLVFFRSLRTFHLWKDVGTIPLYYVRQGYGPAALIGVSGPVDTLAYPANEVTVRGLQSWSFVNVLRLMVLFWRHRDHAFLIYHLCFSTAMIVFALRGLGIRRVFIKLDINQFVAGRLVMVDGSRGKKGLKAWARHLTYLCVKGVLVETVSVAKALGSIPVLRDRIHVVPNGGFSDVDRNVVDHQRENVFIFAGRLGAIPKNANGVLEALRNIKTLKNWKFIFAGPTESPDFLRDMEVLRAERPDLSGNVFEVGNLDRDSLYSLFSRAKFLVAPSLWEGSSIAVAEALSMGVNVIGTDTGILEDLANQYEMPTVIRGQKRFYDYLYNAMSVDGSDSLPTDTAMRDAFRACGRHQEVVGALTKIIDDIVAGSTTYFPYPEELTANLSHEAVANRLAEVVRAT